jgi:hypothetical protein
MLLLVESFDFRPSNQYILVRVLKIKLRKWHPESTITAPARLCKERFLGAAEDNPQPFKVQWLLYKQATLTYQILHSHTVYVFRLVLTVSGEYFFKEH